MHLNSELENYVKSMVCSKTEPIPLSFDDLTQALELKGDTFLLKAHYDDFEDELKNEKIKYKISQALSVIVCYEDDGASFEEIKKFITYINSISDEVQIEDERIRKEKALVFVSATRAKKTLLITSYGDKSEFLS